MTPRNKLFALSLSSAIVLALSTAQSIGNEDVGAYSFNSDLVDAANLGDTDTVAALISYGTSPDERGDFGTTALMRAAFQGNSDLVKYLLKNGANPNIADVGGGTALHIASREGHESIVKLLAKNGADVNLADNEGNTPLMKAAGSGRSDTAKTLIALGAKINTTNDYGETAIVQATQANSADTVAFLTTDGAKTQVASATGETPLEIAEKKGDLGMVIALSDAVDANEEKAELPNVLKKEIAKIEATKPKQNSIEIAEFKPAPVPIVAAKPVMAIAEKPSADVANLEKKVAKLEKKLAEVEEKKLAEKKLAEAEAAKIKAEELAALEAKKVAKLEAEKEEAIKFAKLEAEKEAKRIAKIEAEKIVAQKLAEAKEAEQEAKRLAQIEAEKIAAEELAAAKAAEEEKMRLAELEAEKEEAVKLAKLEAEKEAKRIAKIEAEKIVAQKLAEAKAAEQEAKRLAQIEAEKIAAEEMAAAKAAEEEEMRLAALEAEKEEAEKLAKLEAEKEAQRIAKLEEQKKEAAEKELAKVETQEKAKKSVAAELPEFIIANDDTPPPPSRTNQEIVQDLQDVNIIVADNTISSDTKNKVWLNNLETAVGASESLQTVSYQAGEQYTLLDLGSFKNEAFANNKISDLKSKYGNLFKDVSLRVIQKGTGDSVAYYVNAGILKDRTQAIEICKALITDGVGCRPVETRMMTMDQYAKFESEPAKKAEETKSIFAEKPAEEKPVVAAQGSIIDAKTITGEVIKDRQDVLGGAKPVEVKQKTIIEVKDAPKEEPKKVELTKIEPTKIETAKPIEIVKVEPKKIELVKAEPVKVETQKPVLEIKKAEVKPEAKKIEITKVEEKKESKPQPVKLVKIEEKKPVVKAEETKSEPKPVINTTSKIRMEPILPDSYKAKEVVKAETKTLDVKKNIEPVKHVELAKPSIAYVKPETKEKVEVKKVIEKEKEVVKSEPVKLEPTKTENLISEKIDAPKEEPKAISLKKIEDTKPEVAKPIAAKNIAEPESNKDTFSKLKEMIEEKKTLDQPANNVSQPSNSDVVMIEQTEEESEKERALREKIEKKMAELNITAKPVLSDDQKAPTPQNPDLIKTVEPKVASIKLVEKKLDVPAVQLKTELKAPEVRTAEKKLENPTLEIAKAPEKVEAAKPIIIAQAKPELKSEPIKWIKPQEEKVAEKEEPKVVVIEKKPELKAEPINLPKKIEVSKAPKILAAPKAEIKPVALEKPKLIKKKEIASPKPITLPKTIDVPKAPVVVAEAPKPEVKLVAPAVQQQAEVAPSTQVILQPAPVAPTTQPSTVQALPKLPSLDATPKPFHVVAVTKAEEQETVAAVPQQIIAQPPVVQSPPKLPTLKATTPKSFHVDTVPQATASEITPPVAQASVHIQPTPQILVAPQPVMEQPQSITEYNPSNGVSPTGPTIIVRVGGESETINNNYQRTLSPQQVTRFIPNSAPRVYGNNYGASNPPRHSSLRKSRYHMTSNYPAY